MSQGKKTAVLAEINGNGVSCLQTVHFLQPHPLLTKLKKVW